MDESPAVAGHAVAVGSAAIASLVAPPAGVAVTATGAYEGGIGRVDFVLVDLTEDVRENVLDRKDVDYARPPKHVSEAWSSHVELRADRPYRVFFHVYDRTGVSLVAYDRRDFTGEAAGGEATGDSTGSQPFSSRGARPRLGVPHGKEE